MLRGEQGYQKESGVLEVQVGPLGTVVQESQEKGGDPVFLSDSRSAIGPRTAGKRIPPPRGAWKKLGRTLFKQAVDRWPEDRGRIEVHLVAARVRETWFPAKDARAQERFLLGAQLRFGEIPGLPFWSRTAILDPAQVSWPLGWLEAIDQERCGWAGPSALPWEPAVGLEREPILLSGLVFADLLRMEAFRWLSPRYRSGTPVCSPALDLNDPGAFFSSIPLVDSEGEWERPLVVVREGRLWMKPRDRRAEAAGLGRSTGSLVRPSYRAPGQVGWRSLVVAPSSARVTLPNDCLLINRWLQIGNRPLAGGLRLKAGKPVLRWGPVVVPPPGWWLNRIQGVCGPALPDGNGFPVMAPAAVIPEVPNGKDQR